VQSSLDGIERQPQVARKGVGAAHGNDAEGCHYFSLFGDEGLDHFMDGAVAAAGEDNVRACQDRLAGLLDGGAGCSGGDQFGLKAELLERVHCLVQLIGAPNWILAGNRVVDQDATHVPILRNNG
jgi:hypothetical protein